MTSSHDHCIITEPDHVSSSDVANMAVSSSLVEIASDQPATPTANDTSRIVYDSSSTDDVEQPPPTSEHDCSSTKVTDSVDSAAPPTSGSGPLQQPLTDRMEYLTESCSYDNSNDNLILATPESQSVMEDEQASGSIVTVNNNTTTCCNEDPLVITTTHQLLTDEGNSHLTPTSSGGTNNIPHSREQLHNHLQTLAANRFPELSNTLNPLVKFINDQKLDDDDFNLVTSIICDAIDYDHMIT